MSDRTPAEAFLASADLQDLGGLGEFVPRVEQLPAPTSFATYAGMHDEAIGRVAGPDTTGRWHTAVTADYDQVADRTRIGFAVGIHVEDTDLKVARVGDVSTEAIR